MTEDSILGSSPSGTDPGPDGVVPGEGPIEGREASSATEVDGVRPNDGEPLDYDPPGDARTASHRSRLYGLLALGFERPGERFQDALDAGAFRSDLVESAAVLDDELSQLALAVGTHVETAETLHGDWASLFGVEEGVTVAPYEVTYVPGPLMTNVRNIADVAGFYDAFGLSVAAGENDRQDHLCFELEFVGNLSLREAALREADDEAGLGIVGDARRQFLEDHLGRWYWRFADEVSQHDDGFYATLADLLAGLLEYEIDRLDLDPVWVPDDPAVAEWTEGAFGESGRSCGGCGADATGAGAARPAPGSAPPGESHEPGGPPRPEDPGPDDC